MSSNIPSFQHSSRAFVAPTSLNTDDPNFEEPSLPSRDWVPPLSLLEGEDSFEKFFNFNRADSDLLAEDPKFDVDSFLNADWDRLEPQGLTLTSPSPVPSQPASLQSTTATPSFAPAQIPQQVEPSVNPSSSLVTGLIPTNHSGMQPPLDMSYLLDPIHALSPIELQAPDTFFANNPFTSALEPLKMPELSADAVGAKAMPSFIMPAVMSGIALPAFPGAENSNAEKDKQPQAQVGLVSDNPFIDKRSKGKKRKHVDEKETTKPAAKATSQPKRQRDTRSQLELKKLAVRHAYEQDKSLTPLVLSKRFRTSSSNVKRWLGLQSNKQ